MVCALTGVNGYTKELQLFSVARDANTDSQQREDEERPDDWDEKQNGPIDGADGADGANGAEGADGVDEVTDQVAATKV